MVGSKPTGGLDKALNLGNVAVEGLGFDEDEAGCPWSSGQVSPGKGGFFFVVRFNGGKMGWLNVECWGDRNVGETFGR